MPAHSKKGSILKILGIIFLVIIIIIIVAALIYFYNFFVFKKLIICITPEVEDSDLACESNSECTDSILQGINKEEIPPFLQEKVQETIDKTIFCDETCKNKVVYTNFMGENQRDIEKCEEGEEEISLEIRGKEGLKIINFLRQKET